jgi:hypothetical protein
MPNDPTPVASDPCPFDTNGDGNCGRKTCAKCYPQHQPLPTRATPEPTAEDQRLAEVYLRVLKPRMTDDPLKEACRGFLAGRLSMRASPPPRDTTPGIPEPELLCGNPKGSLSTLAQHVFHYGQCVRCGVHSGDVIVEGLQRQLAAAEQRVRALEEFVREVADKEIYFACKVTSLEGQPNSAINASEPAGAVVLWTRRAAKLLEENG